MILVQSKFLERNIEIVEKVLSGKTLDSVATQFDVTRQRVRQIVFSTCRRVDAKKFRALQPPTILKALRENKNWFLPLEAHLTYPGSNFGYLKKKVKEVEE